LKSCGVLLGLGNPLLDISCCVDKQFLDRYGLSANDAILADERHVNLCKDMVQKYKVEYFAGGAIQNSMRVTQWFLDKPNCVTFMGAIGEDDFGSRMLNKAKEEGVNVVYMVDKSVPTGTCACLITDNGRSRSLCAYLGASQNFKINHLLENYEWVEKARVFYVSGFHLAVSPESILYLAKHAHNNVGKVFCMNLSAPYISKVFSEPLLEVFPYIDILFGNETEAQAFADLNGWQV
jgi:adenosine kinase